MTDTKTLHMERTFRAPAEAVFHAWTSEEVLRRWWHAERDWETTEAEVDPLRVGGAVRVVMRDPQEAVRSHESGWSRAFENLARTLDATDSASALR